MSPAQPERAADGALQKRKNRRPNASFSGQVLLAMDSWLGSLLGIGLFEVWPHELVPRLLSNLETLHRVVECVRVCPDQLQWGCPLDHCVCGRMGVGVGVGG